MQSLLQRVCEEEVIEELESTRHSYVALTRSYHLRAHLIGTRTSNCFGYYSNIKVVRNYTDVNVPNVIHYGCSKIENLSYDYVISERIKGGALGSAEHKKQVEKYVEELSKIKVEKMGRLHFCDVYPYLYRVVEEFPCSMIGRYERSPKRLIARRVKSFCDTIRVMYLMPNFLPGVKERTVTDRIKKLKRIYPMEYCLQHADLHDNNVMVSQEGEVYLLDWEVAGVYPKSYGKARENFIRKIMEKEDRMVMLEQILIEFSFDPEGVHPEVAQHKSRMLREFMNNSV